MSLVITRATADNRPRLMALFQLYGYDFSEILGLDVRDDGHFALPDLDCYWRDPRCHAFLLRVDGQLAGFALVQQRSYIDGDESVCDLAEFCVLRKYRRRGVGEEAARWLFDQFAGWWEVRQKPQNVAATRFWRRVIARYARGELADFVRDDTRWRGPMQRFDSRVAAADRR